MGSRNESYQLRCPGRLRTSNFTLWSRSIVISLLGIAFLFELCLDDEYVMQNNENHRSEPVRLNPTILFCTLLLSFDRGAILLPNLPYPRCFSHIPYSLPFSTSTLSPRIQQEAPHKPRIDYIIWPRNPHPRDTMNPSDHALQLADS